MNENETSPLMNDENTSRLKRQQLESPFTSASPVSRKGKEAKRFSGINSQAFNAAPSTADEFLEETANETSSYFERPESRSSETTETNVTVQEEEDNEVTISDSPNTRFLPKEEEAENSQNWIKSDENLNTALECVSPRIFAKHKQKESLSRKELQAVLYSIFRKRMENREQIDITVVSKIVSERILWEMESSRKGHLKIPNNKQFLERIVLSADEESYLWRGGAHTFESMLKIDEDFDFTKGRIIEHFVQIGIPRSILHRILNECIVRKTCDENLTISETSQLIFAIDGYDDPSSYEFWFRLLDVDGEGIISPKKCEVFYKEVLKWLNDSDFMDTSDMRFANIIEEFCDMLNSNTWTLKVLKSSKFSAQILSFFTNAMNTLKFETKNVAILNKEDDEKFGKSRSIWERLLDHKYGFNGERK